MRLNRIKCLTVFFLISGLLQIHPSDGGIQETESRHCLWAVSSGEAELVFLGSIHVFGEKDYPLDPVIEEAYRKAEAVYFEIDMDSAAMPPVQQKIMLAGMLKNNLSLKDILSDTLYQALSNELIRYGIPIAGISNFKPWMAATILTMIQLKSLGIDPEHGIDNYFYARVKTDRKRTGGMESIDDQIRCFNALENGLEDELLLETMASLDETEKEFNLLKAAWETGNGARIDSVMNRHMNEYPSLKKVLLEDRNARWLGRVEEMIRNREKAMIITGVGHLVGDGSLIDLLREQGYVIEQR